MRLIKREELKMFTVVSSLHRSVLLPSLRLCRYIIAKTVPTTSGITTRSRVNLNGTWNVRERGVLRKH